eukprot:Sspe_Gene.9034::Locus_3041_Transcript_1_1_Confidence_1.000_Length_2170::g.9034::m.9034
MAASLPSPWPTRWVFWCCSPYRTRTDGRRPSPPLVPHAPLRDAVPAALRPASTLRPTSPGVEAVHRTTESEWTGGGQQWLPAAVISPPPPPALFPVIPQVNTPKPATWIVGFLPPPPPPP